MAPKGVRGPTVERLALADRVRRMRDESGLIFREIAEDLGVSESYAQQLYDDPDGAKARARKDSYAGSCEVCGALTSGSNGEGMAPRRCPVHAAELARFWTRERVVAAFQEFERVTGRTPGTADAMGPYRSVVEKLSEVRRRELEEAHELRLLPNPSTVGDLFPGGWGEALEAAGFERSPLGDPSHRMRSRIRLGSAQLRLLGLLADGPMAASEIAAVWDFAHEYHKVGASLIERGLVQRKAEPGRRVVWSLCEGVTREAWDMAMQEWRVLRAVEPKVGRSASFEDLGTVEAPSREIAIEKAASEEGDYVAVQVRNFEVVSVESVARLTVVRPQVAQR